MELKRTQQIASYFIIGMVMWEFFSYYGMQALLILYLTQKLHMPDTQAYAIYGSFTSLIFITPIIGGWLADRFCGYRYAVTMGCLLIIAGHLVLGTMTHSGLYYGLTILILGIGLFKSNAICLISECYPNDSAGRSAALVWYYVSGNIGAVASQLLCPYLAQTIDWYAGFLLAAIGMFLGLLMLIASKKYFHWHGDNINLKWKNTSLFKKITISIALLLISLAVIYIFIKHLWVGYLLTLITLISVGMFIDIYKKTSVNKKSSMIIWLILTLFATCFWIFDMQGTSSISLFISRYINRTVFDFTIPTGSFQSINPGIILIFGTFMAWVWKKLDKANIKFASTSKLNVAFIFLILGFMLITYAAHIASNTHMASLFYPVIGLVLIGAAEIFVDPVLLTAISEFAPAQSEGRLVAMYYLAVGAIANYLAAWVADFTVDPTGATGTAATYHSAYLQIIYISVALFLMLFVVGRFYRKNVS